MNVATLQSLPHPITRSRAGSILIGVASKRRSFRRAAQCAVQVLTSQSVRSVLCCETVRVDEPVAFDGPQQDLVSRARVFLDREAPELQLVVLSAESPKELAKTMHVILADVAADIVSTGAIPCLLLIDADEEPQDVISFDAGLDEAIAAFPSRVRAEASLYHCRVYSRTETAALYFARPYARRHCPEAMGALTADMIAAIADLLEARVVQTVGSGRLAGKSDMTSLGSALYGFLTARAGGKWGLHSYTGSVVSTLIAELEELAKADGRPVVRSPSEHGLACAAMGRWMLDDAPFLIIVTSGMIDEFKGTLANLRSARAKGFLVCADTSGDYWYPFQGAIHQEEDALAVLRSRGLDTLLLDRPERLAEDLTTAFQAYDSGRGPVVLLATPAVLESTVSLDLDLTRSYAGEAVGSVVLEENAAEAVLDILNRQPIRLLWQCGALNRAESDLVHDLARRCGAGLCDSLTRPGFVSKYRDGAVVPEYLGTLGHYGTSPRVFDYIHSNGKPLSADQLCLFFLKSRLAQLATPFSERILEKRMRLVQVTHEAQHLAPFVHHPVCAKLLPFLQYVSERLDVTPAVLEQRRRALREASPTLDTASTFASAPMTPNFFFNQLNELLEQLITQEAYTYTGVYDSGRGAVSAIRNLARTGPGFSGIYGRALMGDGLLAAGAIALSADRNVLVFVGDGAAALVPDIVPSIIQQIYLEQCPLRRNLSIFRLCNGGHSLIRTYREVRRGLVADMQTTVVSRIPPESSELYGASLAIHTRRLERFDRVALREQLLQPKTVNLYSVVLDHNNDGDSIGAHSAIGWQSAQRAAAS